MRSIGIVIAGPNHDRSIVGKPGEPRVGFFFRRARLAGYVWRQVARRSCRSALEHAREHSFELIERDPVGGLELDRYFALVLIDGMAVLLDRFERIGR